MDASTAKRAVGMMVGGVLLVTGNALPKIVGPLSYGRPAASKGMVIERFAGWTFVMTGIVYLVVWLVAPLDQAMLVTSILGLSAFALVIATWAWQSQSLDARQHRSDNNDNDSGLAQTAWVRRCVVLLILHSVCWVFAMFLADSIWGDRVAQWIAVVFVIANGGLLAAMWPRPRSIE